MTATSKSRKPLRNFSASAVGSVTFGVDIAGKDILVEDDGERVEIGEWRLESGDLRSLPSCRPRPRPPAGLTIRHA